MINKDLLQQKCAYIAKDLELLHPYQDKSFDEIAANPILMPFVERMLEKIVTRGIDMNRHILSEIGDGTERLLKNEDTFLALGKHSVISEELAKNIAPSAGLRNRLVHEYNDTDDRIIFLSVGKAIEQYPQYCEAILDFAEKQNEAR
jgi:uncharacterized protein YutE (UPF0331/DUF86 family)